MRMRFVCKAIAITVVILFVALVGFYLWCFTSFRLYFNLLDAPTFLISLMLLLWNLRPHGLTAQKMRLIYS